MVKNTRIIRIGFPEGNRVIVRRQRTRRDYVPRGSPVAATKKSLGFRAPRDLFRSREARIDNYLTEDCSCLHYLQTGITECGR